MNLAHFIFSFSRRGKRRVINFFYIIILKYFAKGISLGKGVCFYGDNYISSTDGGTIKIGHNVNVCRNVRIVSQNASVTIGDNVYIGEGSVIIAKKDIHIGDNVLLGEYVVIRDQAHCTDSIPIRLAGFSTSPIKIESGVWVGAKATVLQGVTICEGAVIGAHALVNSNIPRRTLAAGIPAKVLKCYE